MTPAQASEVVRRIPSTALLLIWPMALLQAHNKQKPIKLTRLATQRLCGVSPSALTYAFHVAKERGFISITGYTTGRQGKRRIVIALTKYANEVFTAHMEGFNV